MSVESAALEAIEAANAEKMDEKTAQAWEDHLSEDLVYYLTDPDGNASPNFRENLVKIAAAAITAIDHHDRGLILIPTEDC